MTFLKTKNTIVFPVTYKLHLMAGTVSRFITVLENSLQASVPNGTECGLRFRAT